MQIGELNMVNIPSAEELVKLYETVESKQVERGVKGEKSGIIKQHLRAMVDALKVKGVTELSQATLRNAIKEIMTVRNAAGEVVTEPKMDPSYFSTIVSGIYETKHDPKTGAILVLTSSEKSPKVRKAKKAKAAVAPVAQ
jgi:hypothetical protein